MAQQVSMRIISVNVGLPRTVAWKGRQVSTGIFKQPIEGQIAIRRLNLDGDQQADLSVHGEPDKAIYAYPAEHYTYWREELPALSLAWGQFGENLTISGLREDVVQIGDRYRVGSAELAVTQPRLPCYKLGIRFGRPDMVRRFLRSGRTGFYFSVLQEGAVQAGDPVTLIERAGHGVTVADITRLYAQDDADFNLLARVVEIDALPTSWREYFSERLTRIAEEATP